MTIESIFPKWWPFSKFETEVKNIYGEGTQVSQPYIRDDGRRMVTITKPDGTRITNQVGRFLLEIKKERPLRPNETVDHIDNDFTNDSFRNLNMLSRPDNAKKGAIGNKHCLGRSQSLEHRLANSGEHNGLAKLKNDDVLRYRNSVANGLMSKEQIMAETGMSDKSIRNLLTGKSYTEAGGPIIKRSLGRPPKK